MKLGILLVWLLAVPLVACGGQVEPTETADAGGDAASTPTQPPPDDGCGGGCEVRAICVACAGGYSCATASCVNGQCQSGWGPCRPSK